MGAFSQDWKKGGKGKAKPALEVYAVTIEIMQLLIIDKFQNINGGFIK